MEIIPIFSSPIMMTTIEEDTSQLKKKDWRYEYAPSASSIDRRVLQKYPKIKKILLNKFKNLMVKYYDYHNDFIITTSWFTKTRRGEDCQFHNHKNSFWSGIYYYDSYEDGVGNLEFMSPLGDLADFMIIPKFKRWNEYNSTSWSITPSEKKLIFFPSYLRHRIRKHEGKKDRTSLAFNIVPLGQYGEYDSTYNTSWT